MVITIKRKNGVNLIRHPTKTMITKITIQKQLSTLNEILSQLEDGLADKSNALDNAQDSNNEDRIDKLQHECDTIEEGISELESLIAILEDYEQ